MSAVVVAGGVSKRFGQDKGLVMLAGKPLILHVLDRLDAVIDDVVVVVNSEEQKRKFAAVAGQKARVVVDKANVQSPLVGALAGFESVKCEYTLLSACDTPFLSNQMLSLLLDVCVGKNAAIPRWPNGNIEPLHAAYCAKTATEAARTALGESRRDMRSMIANMRNIRYISTLALRQFDPKLNTFFNINTPNDLQRAEAFIRSHNH